MNIAILGGTGKEGAGLAVRWAKLGHSIIIGSRDPERARAKAAELRDVAHAIPIVGHSNKEAAELGELVVVALPASGLAAPDSKNRLGRVVRLRQRRGTASG